MPPWSPGMAWPTTTPGGALSPRWGGYTKLFVRAAIGAGNTFHVGPHTYDRLDAGNVLSSGVPVTGGELWVDIACDVVSVDIVGGATASQGIFTKPDAATATVTIADPDGEYDPLAPAGRFSYGGRSRLVPGVPIQITAEVVDAATGAVTTHALFTGTADSWSQDWTAKPSSRQTVMIASDATKDFVNLDRPEQPPAGAADTTAQRVHRIVDYFGWTGTVVDPPGGSSVTLAATTLAQPAWELLNRTLDDELGWIYLTPDGKLRWLNRQVWSTVDPPVVELGCVPETTTTGFDILVDATPSAADRQIRNAVYAARTGGTTQQSISQASIDRYGRYDYKRTDLGLADDTQVGVWTAMVLQMFAYPQINLTDVTMHPAIAAEAWKAWKAVLSVAAVTDIVRIRWAPPDLPAHVVDNESRVVGWGHQITRTGWEVRWQLVAANLMEYAGVIFHLGPHPNDRLDSNYVLGLTAA